MKGVFRFRRRDWSFVPVGDEAKEALSAVKDGKEFMAEVHAPRNAAQFRLWWALVTILAEHDDVGKEAAKDGLLCAIGEVVPVWDWKHGLLFNKPKSIAYESMTQAAFSQLFDKGVAAISGRLGTAPEDIRNRVEEMISGPKT